MKYIGIDYGEKHIGIALSDQSGSIAMPKKIIPNTHTAFDEICLLIKDEDVTGIVIGESRDFLGNENKIQTEITPFAERLKTRTGLPVSYTSELFSSRLAKQGTVKHLRINPRNVDSRKRNKVEKRIDDKAAAIMLQSFLDTR